MDVNQELAKALKLAGLLTRAEELWYMFINHERTCSECNNGDVNLPTDDVPFDNDNTDLSTTSCETFRRIVRERQKCLEELGEMLRSAGILVYGEEELALLAILRVLKPIIPRNNRVDLNKGNRIGYLLDLVLNDANPNDNPEEPA